MTESHSSLALAETNHVGERLRNARKALGHSLQTVAGAAGISAATLSRIETNKQTVDLSLFLQLAGILQCDPRDILPQAGQETGAQELTLARRITVLEIEERRRLWNHLAEGARGGKRDARTRRNLTSQVEELLAHLELLREEIETVRRALGERS